MVIKKKLGLSVLEAAQQRIEWVFDTFPRIYLSFSGGKDSGVMLHLVMQEAKKRNRKIAVLFIDLEAQYKLTIDYIESCYEKYKEWIDPYWICLPINLRNAVSTYEPQWRCWDDVKKDIWVRQPPKIAITNPDCFPFFYRGMEFEEFTPAFGHWYSDGKPCACFVGIRTVESLNRWRSIAGRKSMFENKRFTTYCNKGVYNVYPIYDWETKDIWIYNGKFNAPYNKLYDIMHKAGLSIHEQRICQPYGDDQRKGLWLFHLIEPETWSKIVARVNGANSGALYAQESGNILGRLKISKPEHHTWESFAKLLLSSMPPKTKIHFENKIETFIKWYEKKGYSLGVIPDEADPKDESSKKVPSWRRICKALLRNDYWCKGLSFSQTKSDAYGKYLQIMNKRKKKWTRFINF